MPFVSPGGRVAAVSPSGPSNPAELLQGINRLRERFVVQSDDRCSERAGFLAGSDELRARALLDALEDPSVRAVICTRGGYGAMRLLAPWGAAIEQALTRDPKPILGFSDVTALHMLWLRVGVFCVHGPMLAAWGGGRVNEAHMQEALAVLEGKFPAPWTELTEILPGKTQGIALGGNLSLLAALQGTRYQLPATPSILFLEDLAERPYRIDRMLTALQLSGALEHVRGIVLGDFVDCAPGPDGINARQVLEERLVPLGVPILADAPFGHGVQQRAIPFGATARIEERAVFFEPPGALCYAPTS